MLNIITQDQQINSRTIYSTLPDENVSESKGDTVPDISNNTFLVFKNTGALTISNFTGGLDGRKIYLLGDGFTSLDNNATIKTSTGAIKLLGLHLYILVSYQNIWYELN